ncbi:MAG: UDP-N-acetylmuramoyl-tripeptide--D-alanyl-D-alanine ligase [Betaproteobacteria bacterium]
MMDTGTAAKAIDGQLIGENVAFQRVVTDSRTLESGDLFVALKGERFDGHEFVAAAFAQGATAALVAADRANALHGDLISVSDPMVALGRLAAFWRAKFDLPLAVVVGSNGKTTVKEMLASIFRAHYGDEVVLATQGNLNNAIGLPLTLLRLRAQHRAAVVELGMNHRGETFELGALAQPTIALVNNAQREHQEFMNSVSEVAAEHADAILSLRPRGTAVINADDAHADKWRAAARAVGAAVVDFGFHDWADVSARCTLRAEGSDIELRTYAGNARVQLQVPGRHMASNALAATAAALAARLPLSAIVVGLAAFRPVTGRLSAVHAMSGAMVIDDTYNANPDSVRAAIDVLAHAPGAKWLVLGDMGEVGAQGPAFHQEIGAYAKERGVLRLFTTGDLTRGSAAAFGDGALHVASVEELSRVVREAAIAGVTILVKGSRSMRMERVVAALTGQAMRGPH